MMKSVILSLLICIFCMTGEAFAQKVDLEKKQQKPKNNRDSKSAKIILLLFRFTLGDKIREQEPVPFVDMGVITESFILSGIIRIGTK